MRLWTVEAVSGTQGGVSSPGRFPQVPPAPAGWGVGRGGAPSWAQLMCVLPAPQPGTCLLALGFLETKPTGERCVQPPRLLLGAFPLLCFAQYAQARGGSPLPQRAARGPGAMAGLGAAGSHSPWAHHKPSCGVLFLSQLVLPHGQGPSSPWGSHPGLGSGQQLSRSLGRALCGGRTHTCVHLPLAGRVLPAAEWGRGQRGHGLPGLLHVPPGL